MGDVLVVGGRMDGERLSALDVELHGLPPRTLDRATVLAWMKDGHSFIPRVAAGRGPAMLLIEVEDEHFVRADSAPTKADSLPDFSG